MKNYFRLTLMLAVIALMGCENPIAQETRVHEDGSLDKSIIFEKTDSSVLERNIFHVGPENGWKVSVSPVIDGKNNDKLRVQFDKSFPSAEAMNAELDAPSDTLFRVKSSFEKKFRWFYTYIRYSETYRPLNRFMMLPYDDFFNAEDMQFIRRLPAEGARISKADSVSLQMLNVKVDDYYARAAIANEQVDILRQLLVLTNTRTSLLDSLESVREVFFEQLENDKGDENFVMRMTDSLKIKFADRARAATVADSLSESLNARLQFMSYVRDGRYQAMIEIPWTVVETNADSVVGNRLYWRPLQHKFLFTDYELYAESRQLNVLTATLSAVLIGFTLLLWIWRARRNKSA
ncbi:MAG: hypothetical protein JNN04_16040 [Cyclobacteriaceae bacterium]|nr:hypothetical protein [Cyclobacteriaceae bacterium]